MNKREQKAREKRATEEVRAVMNGENGSGKDGKMTVHDFRELNTCVFCNGMGYKIPLLSCDRDVKGRKRNAKYAHADCIVREKGETFFLYELPLEEAMKGTFGQLGPRIFKKLFELYENPKLRETQKPKPKRW